MKSLPLTFLTAMLLLSPLRAIAQGSAPASANGEVTYQAHGVIQAVDQSTRQLTISHDRIPGYMDAMTMSFDLRDFSEAAGLAPGDVIDFRLCVTKDKACIDHIKKTGATTAPLITAAAPGPVRELSVGDPMPDAELIDQSGKKIHFNDFRGKTVAITFIYTRCQLPTYCPLMNSNFRTAQALMARLGEGDNWRLLSLSMDPETDTPSVLAEFAKYNEAAPDHWTFATASNQVIRQFGGAVGLEFRTSSSTIYHNLRTVVVGADGRIRAIFNGNSWTPQDLVSAIRAGMRVSK